MNLIPRNFYLDDFFDDFQGGKNNMKCDIYETKKDYHIDVELPGFNKDEIKLETKNGYLTVSASKEDTEHDENKNYLRRERVYSKVERTFSLGDINEEHIEAEFKNGVLMITIPKKEENNSKKYIEIK